LGRKDYVLRSKDIEIKEIELMDENEVLEPEVMPEENAVVPADHWNTLYKEHREFKNSWVGVRASISDHQSKTIQKLQRLEKLHEEVNDVLDKEIDNFETFRKENLNI
jgi:hypothetical protein